jgi:hypothetical protein
MENAPLKKGHFRIKGEIVMKRFQTLGLVSAMVVLLGAPAAIGAADTPAAAPAASMAPAETPHAVLPELKYEFEAVVDGTLITHDFKIKNEGAAELAIQKVKTG